VLTRQRLTKTWDKKYALHAVANNHPWPSTCAITYSKDTPAFWEADFAAGSVKVKQVDVRFLLDNRKALIGAKVYVGDHLCGEVGPPKQGKKRKTMIRKKKKSVGNTIDYSTVDCGYASGDKVRIEKPKGPLALCDVVVYKGDKFPTK